jgi:signal recognition particle subunit SRP54
MFELLSEKLSKVFKNLGNKGKLTEKDIDDALREIRLALLEADVHFKVVKEFLAVVKQKAMDSKVLESLTPQQQIIKLVNEELTGILGRENVRLKTGRESPTTLMLVGLQGSGKTTTASKLALNLKHAGNRPLLVAADTRRPAAIDQLIVLGKQIDIPVFSDKTGASPETICRNALKQCHEMAYNWMIIDTQGRLHIDTELMNELQTLKSAINPDEILLVIDAMTGQESVKIAEEFNNQLTITGLILTKMDGDARGGAALSIRSVTGIPIKFIGTGEKTSALDPFYPDRLASRILGMGDLLTLIEKTEKTFDKEQAKILEKKIRKSELNLEDFLQQLHQLKKMGPISQLFELMPGMNKLPKNVFDGTEDTHMKRIEAIILSMTPYERQNPDIINGSRRKRIAGGSGTTPRDINQLLNQFEQVKKITRMAAQGKMPRNLYNMFK